MLSILCCWIGSADLKSINNDVASGPIVQAVTDKQFKFDQIHLLSDWDNDKNKGFCDFLATRTPANIILHESKLSSPVNYHEIYTTSITLLTSLSSQTDKFYFHLSPGTPAMAAVWIIIAKTLYPATLIHSSKEEGVKIVSIPFDIAAEFIPTVDDDNSILKLAEGILPENPAFGDILHNSDVMKKVIIQAQLLAVHSIPVLIQGESGTGKELLARAIHNAGRRQKQPFIAVNCGAIPEHLAESELFGHEKGAFTGAQGMRKGYLEEAHGGTLFLDEIGELSLSLQVKLLRALQEKEILRVGASKPIPIDVRIITATNRNLYTETTSGKFREDLFHRLAVGVIKLPPLRERHGDINLLIDKMLEKINREFATPASGWKDKKISINARSLMIQYSWPGNIRELINTLTRALLWAPGTTIEVGDIKNSILGSPAKNNREDDVLNQPLIDGFELEDILDRVKIHYIQKALKASGNNRKKAAEMLGFPNYQTLNNWMKKLSLNESGM